MFCFVFAPLQELISTTKSFGDAYDSIRQKLTSIEERFHTSDGLQPDILAKKSQADQLKVSTTLRLSLGGNVFPGSVLVAATGKNNHIRKAAC